MPVWLTPNIKFISTHSYTWVEKGTVRVPKNTTQCQWPGFEPGQLNPKSSTLTIRPPCIFNHIWYNHITLSFKVRTLIFLQGKGTTHHVYWILSLQLSQLLVPCYHTEALMSQNQDCHNQAYLERLGSYLRGPYQSRWGGLLQQVKGGGTLILHIWKKPLWPTRQSRQHWHIIYYEFFPNFIDPLICFKWLDTIMSIILIKTNTLFVTHLLLGCLCRASQNKTCCTCLVFLYKS